MTSIDRIVSDELLLDIRMTVRRMRAEDRPISQGPRASFIQLARDLANAIENLDQRLTIGAPLPKEWSE